MNAQAVTLTADKSAELEQALSLAGANGEWLSSDFSLTDTIHPVTKEFGFALKATAPATADADLLVIQHSESGVIQFVFPEYDTPHHEQNKNADIVKRFGFIAPHQLGAAVADAEKWVGRAALKITKNLPTDVIWAIARTVEAANKTESFIALSNGYETPATPQQLDQAQGQRVLIFIHGIFSSIAGAFSDLGKPDQDDATMQKLIKAYNGHAFGYDHWTISKTPLENALDLLDKIPLGANWTVDLVCHSRGGLITRALCANPSTTDKLDHLDLHKIVSKRNGKVKDIGKVCFVAAANQGSPLANPDEIRKFLNIAALLASKSPCFALNVVVGLARVLVSSAFNLPSVQQLATTSSLVKDLNQIKNLMNPKNVFGVRADFDYAHSILLEMGVLLDKLLMKIDNDLVVPYDGVASTNPTISAADLLEFGTPNEKQGKVWHTNFFGQERTKNYLVTHFVS
ncbi:esterase/lipase family protein [Uliginosibacterium gangwonense]|uniref:esterase/lipase family protein n=1 Tax=Uliginosibacterium gangwonense TaxID=392736 RepID=UPI000380FA34|nr:hypothetical protein [Uliginosibacterium gangwonense]